MKRYRAEQSVVADGVPLAAGDEFDEDEVPPGTLVCMVRTGQAVELPAEGGAKPPEIAHAKPPALQTAAPKSAAKK